MTRSAWANGLVVHALLAGLMLPFIPLVIWSLTARWQWPDLLPQVWSLQPWRYLLAPSTGMMPALAESLLLAVVVTSIALLISLPAGQALGQREFPGKSLVELMVMLPILMPTFAVALGLHATFLRYGLADTRLGVALVHLIPTAPYMVRVLAAAYASLGIRLEEQARTLGASHWQVFTRVTLPRLLPAIAAGSVFVFLGSLGQYITTLLIGGGQVVTLPVVLYPQMTGGDRGMAAAASLILATPALLFIWSVDWTVRQVYRVRELAGS